MSEKSEFLDFDVDKSILSDLVFSQNGTIESGVRELVMNAFDANSFRCEITLGKNRFEVLDQGDGFEDEDSIHKFFKTFGTPHQEGDALYGRFRIGRGQIMAFGRITWHSKQFMMSTDIKAKGMGFDLTTDMDSYIEGCKVSGEFYEPVPNDVLNFTKDSIARLVKYTQQDVFINGLKVNEPDADWDYEDEELKIKWNPNDGFGTSIYSLGVFVRTLSSYEYGVDAHIVTKKALNLNMARNDISDSDPLYRKIKDILRERMIEEGVGLSHISGETGLPEATRLSLIKQLINGSIGICRVLNLPLIRDYRGHKIKLSGLINDIGRGMPLIVAPEAGNRVCDRLATTKEARVLHQDELRVWQQPSMDGLINLWCELINQINEFTDYNREQIFKLRSAKLPSYEQMSETIDDKYIKVKQTDLSKQERAAKSALNYVSKIMASRISKQLNTAVSKRTIKVGKSEVADGWTDGATYICVGQHLLSKLEHGFSGATELILLLLHEYCHDANTAGSHEHGFEFYEKYHDLSSSDIVGYSARVLLDRFSIGLCKTGQTVPQKVKEQYNRSLDRFEFDIYANQKRSKLEWSGLAKVIFSGFKANVETSKGYTIHECPVLTFPKPLSLCDCIQRSVNILLEEFAEAGIEWDKELKKRISSAERNYEFKNLRQMWDEFLDKLASSGAQWVQESNNDLNAFQKFILLAKFELGLGRKGKSRFEDRHLRSILHILCVDDRNSVTSFSTSDARKSRRLSSEFVSKQVDLKHDPIKYESLAGANQKSERFSEATSILKDLVNSLNDDGEREEFISLYINDNLAVELA
ncbi:ATP-binding protein [Idiomarina abyssalis]|uniref:ATP-binding protein n=1 Tax=Idiomarina abyssalis TaxID=86102 RepID=A0A8I1KIG4_9GAMM|nr:ATP-binding protein [Idiomarina abyssalis]MBJ7265436.1 ATP-binding protein [Idiomarina abyssalis]MBJ7316890.1 ATP-binding protein [Idiomarina abyssalis]